MLKVFLTEDESIVREGLRDNIPWEQYGFTFVGEASDGETALPLIRKLKPDILITDIKMPFMDGLAISAVVSRELPNTKIILISGYDDFDYARQAIELHVDQYLLKPVTRVSMLRALEQTKKRIEEEQAQRGYQRQFRQESLEHEDYARRVFFEQLMDGSLSPAQLNEQAARLGIDLDAPGYNLVLFSLQPRAARTDYSEVTARLYDELIRYFLHWPEYILFRCNLFSYAILIKGNNITLQELTRRCVDNIRTRCEASESDVEWYAVIGTPVGSLQELPKCFSQVNRILSLRFLLPGQHVLTEDTAMHFRTEDRSRDLIEGGSFDPMMIRSFIQSGMKSEIGSFTRNLFSNLGDAVNTLLVRHYLIMCVRVNAAAALNGLGCDSSLLIPRLPPVAMDMSNEELEAYFSRTLEAALRVRDEESQKQNSSIIENALLFIDQNYTDESISLNVVAKAINISANYLSAVFSQKMGVSFVEYLTRKRMEKAKQLLRNSSKRSGEIAYEVGYKDPRYFSFVFKKTQGCTPRDYRTGEKESK